MKVLPTFPSRFVCGRHVHHGLIGLVLAVLGYFPRRALTRLGLATVGAVLMVDDAEDWPWIPERKR